MQRIEGTKWQWRAALWLSWWSLFVGLNDVSLQSQTPASKPAFPFVHRKEPLSFLLFVILLAPSTLEFDTHSRNTNTQFIMSRRVNASTDAAKEVTASPRMS